MATVNEVVAWAKGLADQGQGVDFDGVYGKQCVDLPNWILGKFFSKSIWGNAIDLLTSAKQVGYQVIYDAPGVNPKMGDLFVVKSYGHPYGHTGLVIADSDGYTIKTIEQNVDGYRDDNRDGINDQFQFGGPARYVTRKFDQADGKVIGWIRPPYGSSTIPQNVPAGLKKIKDEKGIMTVKVAAVNVRDTASLKGKVVAKYLYDQSFAYDSVYEGDGYIWVSYIGKTSGQRRFVACGIAKNGVNIAPFGTFK